MDSQADYRLGEADLIKFERDGYIGPFKLYEPEEMERRWNEIRRQLLDRTHALYPAPDGGAGLGIHNYDRHLDVDLLSELVCEPRIVDRLISILGPNILCWRSEFFPKYPGDEGTDWHQEGNFATGTGHATLRWPDEDAANGALTIWTAFTDSTIENGCLQVIPGTHRTMHYDEDKLMTFDMTRVNKMTKSGIKRGFYGYDYRELQLSPDFTPDEDAAVPLVMRRGECVILWSTILHASLPHAGAKSDYRIGFGARFNPPRVAIYPDKTMLVEHGAAASLKDHRCVMVAGKDTHGINRFTDVSRRGYRFVPRQLPHDVRSSAV